MPELHSNGLQGAEQDSVSTCSLCEHQSVLMMTWSQGWEKRKSGSLKENCHKIQAQTQWSHKNRHHWPRKLNECVCESRRYFRSILIFMLKRFRLRRKTRLSQLRIATMSRRKSSWHSNAQRQVIPVAHLLFLLFLSMVSLHKHHMEWFFTWSWCEKSSKRSGREHPSPLCINVLHQMDNKALCSMSVLKSG